MSTNRQRDADMDRLLRAVLKPESDVHADACPDAGLLAAFAEGGVSESERAALDEHIVHCGRCQETLAVLARDDSPQKAETAGARWFTWVTRPRLRWLIPITAAATAAVLFVATRTLLAPGGFTTLDNVTKFAQAPPPPPPIEGVMERDTSAASPAKSHAESAWRQETGKRQANLVPGAKPVADAVSVPARVGQAAAEKRAAAEAAADLAERLATHEKRARAAAAPAATDVSARTSAAPKMAAADAVREAPLRVAGREELRNELRNLHSGPIIVEAPGGAVRWRFALAGQIWRSADAGSTWHSQPSGVSADLFAGSAPTPATCWAVGADGTVLLTQDGERWERRPFPLSVDLTAIEARNARIATVTTRDGRRFETLDRGATWSPR